MHRILRSTVAVLALSTATLMAADNPFIGNWALTLPNGGAGWLGISEKDGKLQGSILWGGGSPVDASAVSVEGQTLVVTRIHTIQKKEGVGRPVPHHEIETIRATLSGDELSLTTERKAEKSDKIFGKAEFKGKRIPPPGAAPDLSKVKFGEPIELFNGKDLTGWRLIDPHAKCGWMVENGLLINRVEKKPGVHFGNLRTDREFEDFRITLEARPTAGSNSGVYLRGIYEVQILESYGKPVDCHNMGAIYGRITPTSAAEKPAGEWQTLDITLVDRHATVILNGVKIIDNQPIIGCTGGALTSDEFKPGPIYLQGDHTNIEYRNIVLRPVIK